jgi:hypothetical protein
VDKYIPELIIKKILKQIFYPRLIFQGRSRAVPDAFVPDNRVPVAGLAAERIYPGQYVIIA